MSLELFTRRTGPIRLHRTVYYLAPMRLHYVANIFHAAEAPSLRQTHASVGFMALSGAIGGYRRSSGALISIDATRSTLERAVCAAGGNIQNGFVLATLRSFRGKGGLADFIKQRPVTTLKLAGGAFSIPAIGFEHAQNDFLFQIVHGLARNFFQMDRAVGRQFRSQV